MPQEWEIRPAGIGDAAAIRDVFEASIRGLCAGDYTPAEIESWAGRKREDGVTRAMEEGEAMMVAVAPDGRVMGFSSLKGHEVVAVYVHPEAAGAGMGRALLQAVERLARNNGESEVTLDSSITAQDFYLRNGWRPVSRTAKQMSDGCSISCILMRKKLR